MLSFVIAAALLLTLPSAAAPRPVKVEQRTEADGTHTLVHETVIDAAAKDVWSVISSAEGWKSWAVPVAWTPAGDPDVLETSYSKDAAPGGTGNIKQRFLVRVPGRMLAFRTVQAPQGFPDFDTYAKVTSVFELEPLGAKRTRVRLTGVGYAGDEAGRRLVAFFRKGNSTSLEWLRARFVTGPKDWSKK